MWPFNRKTTAVDQDRLDRLQSLPTLQAIHQQIDKLKAKLQADEFFIEKNDARKAKRVLMKTVREYETVLRNCKRNHIGGREVSLELEKRIPELKAAVQLNTTQGGEKEQDAEYVARIQAIIKGIRESLDQLKARLLQTESKAA